MRRKTTAEQLVASFDKHAARAISGLRAAGARKQTTAALKRLAT
jgi:hypothetical protein